MLCVSYSSRRLLRWNQTHQTPGPARPDPKVGIQPSKCAVAANDIASALSFCDFVPLCVEGDKRRETEQDV